MDLREYFRRFFVVQVGNGEDSNAWEDNWMGGGFLSAFIPFRWISRHGFSNETTVAELVERLGGVWPREWKERFNELANNTMPSLQRNCRDILKWRCGDQNLEDYSVKEGVRSLTGTFAIAQWHRSVWFKGHIPKHAFCLWLACNKRLPTQDRLRVWKHEPPDMRCSLCTMCEDSHNHLFFRCQLSLEVWHMVTKEVDWNSFPSKWDDILEALEDGNRTPKRLPHRLALATMVYFIWQERNNRMFNNRKRNVLDLTKQILETIRARVDWKTHKRRIKSNVGEP